MNYSPKGNGVLRYQRRLYVPDVDGLRDLILEEARRSCYSIHVRSTQMYYDLNGNILIGKSKRGHSGTCR